MLFHFSLFLERLFSVCSRSNGCGVLGALLALVILVSFLYIIETEDKKSQAFAHFILFSVVDFILIAVVILVFIRESKFTFFILLFISI
jgi:hypothetical protein